jgi:cyclic beta-1,2-glucan synthetase
MNRLLAGDPAGAYSRMEFESRERYCETVAELARFSQKGETEVAEAVLHLSEQVRSTSDGSRAAVRRMHVGFYLLDKGRKTLEEALGYRAPWRKRIPRLILRYPTSFYLIGIELLTLAMAFGILYRVGLHAAAYAALIFLALPATQAAVDFVNNLTTFLLTPRVLPQLDFSEGIPADCVTLVAVPTLFINEAQVRDLVLDLEIRYLANCGPNLYFALLSDTADSDRPEDEHDPLVDLATRLIEGLNSRYRAGNHSPFFLLHRHRVYNQSEDRWMGWERKRGKLLDLNQYLRGGFDAFPVKVGDASVLPDVRYVITLDSDTQLPRDSAARLVGTIAHPLNQAVIDSARGMVVEGYGILQPKIGISVQSASRSRLASLYSGQTGFDIYTRAVSDVYQDLFGEGIFTGKGIYEVDILRAVLQYRFPENALLSHDLIEGAYARTALVTDIELIDDYPSHFSAYSRRKHRWMRGDWQIVRWIGPRVPAFGGRIIGNPISPISQWKIFDNLRRSVLEVSLLLLLLNGWLWLPGGPAFWTAASVLMWSVPALSGLGFALLGVPRRWRALPAWLADTGRKVRDSILITICSLIFLLHQALISIDAIVRSIARVFVTRTRLLEWETAAQAEEAAHSKATVDLYLEWTPAISAFLALAVWLLRPDALRYAAPLLALWALSRPFSSFLNRRPREGHSRLSKADMQLVRESADRIWRFFHDWSTASTNWLIPDSVHEDSSVELRLSPTNLGMLLNARIAAVHLGSMSLGEFVFHTRQTLDQVLRLPKHWGHLFNWYDIRTLEPLEPRFVSTVDSGNLAVSLWTLKQAVLAMASAKVKLSISSDLEEELRAIAEISERLVQEMDFRPLYLRREKVLSIGYDVTEGRLEESSYNLLASEACMASFVAIAKGDIPQQSWFRLGRGHTSFRGERVLLSWTGTMFEYLMPTLWMRRYADTILDQSVKAVVRCQREYGRSRGVPWGISESAFVHDDNGDYGYAAFGVPELALKSSDSSALVISPYSTFLAVGVDAGPAVANLRLMESYGWTGRYGFYEAVDYTRAGAEPVRMWMAHHQGMSLLAIVNLLFGSPFLHYFHAEPQVLATERLLHERTPAAALSEVDLMPLPLPVAQPLTNPV